MRSSDDCLRDILDCCKTIKEAVDIIDSSSEAELNKVFLLKSIKSDFTDIGEALNNYEKVTGETKFGNSIISDYVSFRNVITHQYYRVDFDILIESAKTKEFADMVSSIEDYFSNKNRIKPDTSGGLFGESKSFNLR